MSVLNRKLRRDLLGSKGLILAIVGVIGVGIACYSGMASAYRNLAISKQHYYTRCQMADFWVDLRKAPNSVVEEISHIHGISILRTRIGFEATVDLPGVSEGRRLPRGSHDEPLGGRVLSMPKQRQKLINNILMQTGSYFGNERDNEVIVSSNFAKLNHLRLGDTIHLLLNQQRKEFIIVGTAISSEFVFMIAPGTAIPDNQHYGIFWIKRQHAEEIFDFQGACNQVVGMLDHEIRSNPQIVLEQIETVLRPYGVIDTTALKHQISNFMLTNEINQGTQMAYWLPSIFLAVAALILNVLMTRMTEQQRTIVGTLKALGYTNLQIMFHFLSFGLTVGLIGGVIGMVGGYYLSASMTSMYRGIYALPDLRNHFYPGIHAVGVSLGLFFALVGTLNGVKSVMKLQPAEAMRAAAPVSGKAIFLEKWHWFWRRLGFHWQLVLRSLFRNPMRTLVGMFASAMGVSILIMAFFFKDSMIYLVEFQYDKVNLADYRLTFKDEQNYAALEESSRLPGVWKAEPLFLVPCTLFNGRHKKKLAITGVIPHAELTVPCNRAGDRVTVPSRGLMLNQELAKILDVEVGDTLRLIPVKGLRRPHEVPVVKITAGFIGLDAYASFDYLNELVDEISAVSAVQLKVSKGRSTQQAFYKKIKELPKLQSIRFTKQEKINAMVSVVGMMKKTASVLIVFAAVIFFGSILNSNLISISERQREIATFRVLGYRPYEIGTIFLHESMLVNFIGGIFGFPLGYALCLQTAEQFASEFLRMPLYISNASLVWTVVLTVSFTLVAHLFVQQTIQKMDWLQALQVKE